MRHVLSVAELDAAEIERIFAISEDLKSKCARGLREPLLPGRMMALLFEKPSLRTRVSFETAMIHLGGGSMFLGAEAGWGKRESIEDFARVLGRLRRRDRRSARIIIKRRPSSQSSPDVRSSTA